MVVSSLPRHHSSVLIGCIIINKGVVEIRGGGGGGVFTTPPPPPPPPPPHVTSPPQQRVFSIEGSFRRCVGVLVVAVLELVLLA